MNNKLKIAVSLICLGSLFPLASYAAETVPAKRADDKQVEAAASDKDDSLKNASWTKLASKTAIPYDRETPDASLDEETLSSWWKVFNDEDLNKLIETSLSKNRDMDIARARVEAARAQLGMSKGAMLPWMDVGGTYQRVELPESLVDKATDIVPAPLSSLFNAPDRTYNVSALGIDASWEPDFFGRQRAGKKAAEHALNAQNGALYSTWVTLSAETGMTYITLRTLQAELAIAEKHAAVQSDKVSLLKNNYDAGLIDEYPVSAMTYVEKQTKANIPKIKMAISECMARLSILTGTEPGELDYLLTPKALPDVNPVIYHAIPADALRQRPDIYAAEEMVLAQEAKTKEAKAALKPRFTLTGFLGLLTFGGSSLFSSGSHAFAIGPSLLAPLFHGGTLRENVKLQNAKAKEYEASYENTVLKAANEVRTAMTSIVQEQDRGSQLRAGRDAASDALFVAENRYDHGLSDYQGVIDAERSLLSFEDGVAVSHGNELVDLIKLFKSLGGGWQPLESDGLSNSSSGK